MKIKELIGTCLYRMFTKWCKKMEKTYVIAVDKGDYYNYSIGGTTGKDVEEILDSVKERINF